MEIPRRKVFNTGFLNSIDSVVTHALQAGDRPFYEAAKSRRLAELERLGVTGVDAEQQAGLYALDRVFQNDSELSKRIMKIRESMGLPGYLIMPFAQTPANIFDKMLDYSGFGLAKAVHQWGTTAGTKEFNQKLFVDRVARSLTGTGLMMLAYALAEKGILTADLPESSDLRAAEKYAGKQAFSLKLGDKSYSYEWASPVGNLVAAAVAFQNAGGSKEEFLDAAGVGAASAVDTVFRQSFLSGLFNLMSGYSPATSISKTLLGTSSQFTPTVGASIARIVDPTQRETYDPNKLKEQANKLAARTPFVSTLLPAKLDIKGEAMLQSQGRGTGARAAENLILPFIRSDKKRDAVNDELLRLQGVTGKNEVLLNTAEKSITRNNQTFKLTTKEYQDYQKYMGQEASREIQSLISSDGYSSLNDDDKAKAVAKINDAARKNAQDKILILRGLPTKSKTNNNAFADYLNQNK